MGQRDFMRRETTLDLLQGTLDLLVIKTLSWSGGIDGRVLAVTAGLTLITAVVFSILPRSAAGPKQ
jgi:hypothetical protein